MWKPRTARTLWALLEQLVVRVSDNHCGNVWNLGAKQKCMARVRNVADAPFWMSATTRMMLGPPVVEVSLRAIHLVLTIFRPIVRA